MSEAIRVAILEDHLPTMQGYKSFVQHDTDIRIVATATYEEELWPLLAKHDPVHLLILDIEVPISKANKSVYPVHFLILKLLESYPNLKVLVITVHRKPALIKSVLDAHASGYILKDDREIFLRFPSVLRAVNGGSICCSREAHNLLLQTEHKTLLSARQLKVLSLATAYPEKSSKELAKLLGVTDSTVRNTLSAVYERLEVNGRVGAIAKARQLGLLTEPE